MIKLHVMNLGRLIRSPLWLTGLALVLALAWPHAAQADSPGQGYQGPDKCAECHYAEAAAWHESSHAYALEAADRVLQTACAGEGLYSDCTCLECHTTAFDPNEGTYAHQGVTCEACHGAYIEGHPEADPMVLVADASLCQDCHQDTHQQWSSSPHAQANVQCIGCHQVHSQDLRLSDGTLCDSCHSGQRDGLVHTAHIGRGAECVDCHLTSAYTPQAPEDAAYLMVAERPIPASHGFAVSSTGACIACHQEEQGADHSVDFQAVIDQSSRLASEIDQLEEEKRSLQTWAFVALGGGLGVGGMMGAVLVLAIGFVWQGRRRS
jgi:hypothetical protein